MDKDRGKIVPESIIRDLAKGVEINIASSANVIARHGILDRDIEFIHKPLPKKSWQLKLDRCWINNNYNFIEWLDRVEEPC